jgi:hypothetical protein
VIQSRLNFLISVVTSASLAWLAAVALVIVLLPVVVFLIIIVVMVSP